MKIHQLLYCTIFFAFCRCSFNDEPKLPSVENRISDTKEELKNSLISTEHGWKVNYQPTSLTGEFFILLDFNDDGTVRIQSDIVANDGEFRDQIIPYRIDSSQGIELILETYGVFHYLFELQQASFGAEFEFLFLKYEGDLILFESKTDLGDDVTELVLEPATTADQLLISTTSISLLEKGIFHSQNLGGIGSYGNYNIYLSSNDHTISVSLDLNKRIIYVLGIAKGMNQDDISSNNLSQSIDQTSTFTFSNSKIILSNIIEFSFDGIDYGLDQLSLDNPVRGIDSFCDMQQDSITVFSGESISLGGFQMTSSLFQIKNNFTTLERSDYSVNAPFLFDENDNSIIDQILINLPEAAAFQWYHQLPVAEDSTINALGFATVDESNNVEFYLKTFEFSQTENYLEISFNEENLITNEDVTTEQIDDFNQLIDLIFSGNKVYVTEIPTIDNLYIFYNPCNKYKGLILQ